MKKVIPSAVILIGLSLLLSHCEVPAGRNTRRGAATGGLIGAAAGGIIGHQSGRGLQGALIGGAAGGATGALYGNSRD